MSEELPEGWVSASLDQVAVLNPRHPKSLDDSMPISFVRMAAVSESKPAFDSLDERALGEVRKGFTHFAEGDVLFAKITPCMENGKGAVATGLRNGIGCGTTELHVIRPLAGIDPHYVFRFLAQSSVRRAAKENFTGTAGQARVPTSFLEALELPLAPLAEQRRIVAKLAKLLAKVDACRMRLTKIPVLLKRFRQSVLAAACSGRLTADWREGKELEPAAQLLTRLRETRPTKAELNAEFPVKQWREVAPRQPQQENLPSIPETWAWVYLPDLGFMNRGRSRNRPRNAPHLYNGKYPFIQTGDIAQSGGRITTHKQTYSEAGLAQSRLWPSGTICITIAANIADSAILTYPACFPDSVVGLISDGDLCVAEFAEFFIRTAREDLSQFAPATAQKNINVGILGEVAVPLPPQVEQREIVRRVETLFALADRLEARLAQARAQMVKLTPALLARAFRGELVPTEAELARREDRSYEPASVLLDRIRASRSAEALKQKRGRRAKGA